MIARKFWSCALAAHVTGIDAVLREGPGAGGVLGEKQVAVVVKVPNDRDRDADPIQAFDDRRHRGRRLVVVHCDAHQLASRLSESRDLRDRPLDVCRVGIGHGLDHDRVTGTHGHLPHPGGYGLASSCRWHGGER